MKTKAEKNLFIASHEYFEAELRKGTDDAYVYDEDGNMDRVNYYNIADLWPLVVKYDIEFLRGQNFHARHSKSNIFRNHEDPIEAIVDCVIEVIKAQEGE